MTRVIWRREGKEMVAYEPTGERMSLAAYSKRRKSFAGCFDIIRSKPAKK